MCDVLIAVQNIHINCLLLDYYLQIGMIYFKVKFQCNKKANFRLKLPYIIQHGMYFDLKCVNLNCSEKNVSERTDIIGSSFFALGKLY